MMRKFVTAILLSFYLVAQAAAASTLLNYQIRIHRAVEQLERLKKDDAYLEEGISTIKSLIPVSEQVEMDGREVTVDNKWLHDELEGIEAVNVTKTDRQTILEDLKLKLDALDKQLVQAEDISKQDANKQQLQDRVKKILSDDKYKEKKDDWLTAKIKAIRQKVKEYLLELYLKIVNALFGASAQGGWAIRIVFIALLGIAGFFIVRMAMQFKWVKKKPRKKTVLGEEIDEDMKPSDFADAAIAAAKAGDFRTGIRKLYIALLYELSERNLIELDANATNREYLSKVSRFSSLFPAMGYLTDRFDYFWYGMFPSSEQDFSSYLASYREALKLAQAINQQQTQTG
jgi:hypothetical protein